ncbi:hypothetical protein CRE_28488 [Caenorhabditis remanei]|uniref:Uncharacterized protein n=1 Tax=Caenorhabditis remanei TaxID=31234 RepID=E3LMQ3_CAERE|nr:hypothetical protein CRE_28488 [Caenorhabditis remanei]
MLPRTETQSEEGSDIFDYMDEGISRSTSQYSGILTIAPPSAKQSGDFSHLPTNFVTPKNEDPLRRKLVGFLKNTIKIIPLMHKASTDSERNLNKNQKDPSNNNQEEKGEEENPTTAKSARFQSKDLKKKVEKGKEEDPKMMDSESAVYEIDELNSTIAPSSSRQCIVEADLECAVTIKKPKKKPLQRTEFHPRPPFSCVPIYTAILLGLLIVLIVGAVTTIIDMRPAFIYGNADNSTHLELNKTLTSIVEPPHLSLYPL